MTLGGKFRTITLLVLALSLSNHVTAFAQEQQGITASAQEQQVEPVVLDERRCQFGTPPPSYFSFPPTVIDERQCTFGPRPLEKGPLELAKDRDGKTNPIKVELPRGELEQNPSPNKSAESARCAAGVTRRKSVSTDEQTTPPVQQTNSTESVQNPNERCTGTSRTRILKKNSPLLPEGAP